MFTFYVQNVAKIQFGFDIVGRKLFYWNVLRAFGISNVTSLCVSLVGFVRVCVGVCQDDVGSQISFSPY